MRTVKWVALALALCAALHPAKGWAQQAVPQPVYLLNPSFEDWPGLGKTPQGWYYCGPAGETPPDVLPLPRGEFGFGVRNPSWHGNTYVNMVVRDNNTWEGLGQVLSAPLRAGVCYDFGLMAAQSPVFESVDRHTAHEYRVKMLPYTAPVSLRVWGAAKNCEERHLLAESAPVEGEEWRYVPFLLTPPTDLDHLIIEAFYVPEAKTPYNGHVLIDLAGPLMPVHCDTRQALPEFRQLVPPPFATEGELLEFLIGQGHNLRFEAGSTVPMLTCFRDATGKLRYTNETLYLMGKALEDFPGKRLVAIVRHTKLTSDSQAKARRMGAREVASIRPNKGAEGFVEGLTRVLVDNGLPLSQLLVLQMRPSQRYKTKGLEIPHGRSEAFDLYVE